MACGAYEGVHSAYQQHAAYGHALPPECEVPDAELEAVRMVLARADKKSRVECGRRDPPPPWGRVRPAAPAGRRCIPLAVRRGGAVLDAKTAGDSGEPNESSLCQMHKVIQERLYTGTP